MSPSGALWSRRWQSSAKSASVQRLLEHWLHGQAPLRTTRVRTEADLLHTGILSPSTRLPAR